MSASRSESRSNQTTTTQDNSLTTGEGNIFGITNSNIGTGPNSPVTFNTLDAELAGRAIQSVQDIASRSATVTERLAENSNAIAAQVADSQRAFVETASGQKTWLWGAAIMAAIILLRKKTA